MSKSNYHLKSHYLRFIFCVLLLGAFAVGLSTRPVFAAIETYRDEFDSQAYNLSNGTTNWTPDPWAEVTETTNPATGFIQVTNTGSDPWELFFDGGGTRQIERDVDLTSSTSTVTLTFDWRCVGGWETNDHFRTYVDGNLEDDMAGSTTICGSTSGSRSVNLDAYSGSDVTIRFELVSSQSSEDFYVDNVQIEYEVSNPTDISGTVFRDQDADGTNDAEEPGVYNVTVTAYDSTGAAVATTTDGDGNYTLTGLTAATEYRIEFTDTPDFLLPGPAGVDSEGLTTFATAGDTGVDAGLVSPTEYCDTDDPLVALSCFLNGDGVASNSTLPGFVSFPYSSSGIDYSGATYDAEIQEVGTVWGAAYQRSSQYIYTSAFLKRHSSFGPGGPGEIYVLDYSTAGVPVVDTFTLQGLSPANGGSAIDLGSVCRRSPQDGDPDANCDPFSTGLAADYELPTDQTMENVDLDAFGNVGKVGYGDVDISDDDMTLWLVNVNQRALISVDVSDPATLPPAPGATVSQWLLDDLSGLPTCPDSNDVMRPWALKVHDGKVFVGAVCNGEDSQDQANLRAYVFSFPAGNPTAGLTTELFYDLDHTREPAATPGGGPDEWQPWVRDWTDTGLPNQPNDAEETYPQPIVSDIEFAEDGDMVIDVMDRWGHQTGFANYSAVSGANSSAYFLGGDSGGDIVHACYDPVTDSYALEDGNSGTNCPSADTGIGGGLTNDGPSNAGEFYFEDIVANNAPQYHYELTTGGLALLSGSGEVLTTIFDPITENWTQGIQWHDTTSGTSPDEFEFIDAQSTIAGGKSNGLGDPELICEAAPIEVGDRVWEDTDGDGIQDPGEPPIAGVDVVLDCGNGGPVTTTTDANGNYYFNSGGNAAGELTTNTACMVIVDTTQIALTGLNLTTPNADGNASNNPKTDLHDSDAGLDGTDAKTNFTTGPDGESNHTLDFGFTPETPQPQDWGDLPDGPYPTLSGSNGARHDLGGTTWLGNCVDSEGNGQPDVNAGIDVTGGDDNNIGASTYGTCAEAGDDEDSVTPTGQWTEGPAGGSVDVLVTGGDACLSAWVDWNNDGSLLTPNDQIIDMLPVTPGVNPILFDIPIGAATGNATPLFYNRVRLVADTGTPGCNDQTNMAPTGLENSGEVEDYLWVFQDYGDLPVSYSNTKLANNGARHIITLGGPFLGNTVDGEPDGQESAGTNGDDTFDGNDDEDGVTGVGNWSDGGGTLEVTVSGGLSCLDVWLDFTDGTSLGADGDFNDLYSDAGLNSPYSEHIIQTQSMTSAGNPTTLNFFLPDDVADNATLYLRARLVEDPNGDGDCSDAATEYSGGVVSPAGQANSGEVEDYVLTFDPTAINLLQIKAGNPLAVALPLVVFLGLLLLSAVALAPIHRRKQER